MTTETYERISQELGVMYADRGMLREAAKQDKMYGAAIDRAVARLDTAINRLERKIASA